MRLAFISDVHLGNHNRHGGPTEVSLNKRCRQTLDVLDEAAGLAEDVGAAGLIIAGDLFDRHDPLPQLITEVHEILKDRSYKVVVLAGNHDIVSSERGDNALGALRAAGTEVIEEPSVVTFGAHDVELLVVPFIAGFNADLQIASTVEKLVGPDKAKHRILAIHMGVKDEGTPPWLRASKAAVSLSLLQTVMDEQGIAYTFAGDWHDRRSWRRVLQLGALVPTGWDNPGLTGLYGTFALYDTDACEVDVRELSGPRFIKIGIDDEVGEVGFNSVYAEILAHPLRVTEALARASVLGERVTAEVIIDTDAASVEMRRATTAAQSAETLEEALTIYVREMPLEEGVDRDSVLELCKGFMS
jgi:hypothetical protein